VGLFKARGPTLSFARAERQSGIKLLLAGAERMAELAFGKSEYGNGGIVLFDCR